jgi:peroxiredoxin
MCIFTALGVSTYINKCAEVLIGVAHAREHAPVPSFHLKDLKGKKIQIKDFNGDVVVISFWATWCVPCKRELDDLAELYKEHNDVGFKVLAIATDGPETFSAIRGVVKRHRWPFHILPDKEGEVTSILNPRGTVPYSIYVDRTGRIVYDHEGYSQGDKAKMFKQVKKLLEQGKK